MRARIIGQKAMTIVAAHRAWGTTAQFEIVCNVSEVTQAVADLEKQGVKIHSVEAPYLEEWGSY